MIYKQVILTVFVLCFMTSFAFAVAPSGATVTPGTSSAASADAAGSDTNALAGNVTEITLSGFSNTQAWQGYFGNVTGTIQLADSSDNVLYNWSLASPEGEVYASTSNTITWGSMVCADQTVQSGLETTFNIATDDVDGVQETFLLDDHAAFFTNSIEFTLGECNNTKLYNDAGAGTFDVVLLHDGTNTVFTSILQEDVTGFDAATHDFEMIVLEDGHGTDVATDTYYFWVELE